MKIHESTLTYMCAVALTSIGDYLKPNTSASSVFAQILFVGIILAIADIVYSAVTEK